MSLDRLVKYLFDDHCTTCVIFVFMFRAIVPKTLYLHFRILRLDQAYTGFSTTQKLHLLSYLLSKGNFSLVNGLELLPLQNGSFTTFQDARFYSQKVYTCSSEDQKLFPGLENQMLRLTQLSDHSKRQLNTFAHEG